MSGTEQFVAQRMPHWLEFRRDLHRFQARDCIV
jgi:hypothetical protein